jgi:hypothetical protein
MGIRFLAQAECLPAHNVHLAHNYKFSECKSYFAT